MNTERIDFISAYCDRWCERCAYTSRCSAFAVSAATGMCGDFQEGLELAVGRPQRVEPEAAGERSPEWMDHLQNAEMTESELAEFTRREEERRARIDGTPLMKLAWAMGMLAHRWLAARGEQVMGGADAVVTEALEIAGHDALFVTAKVHRALDGRDRFEHRDEGDEHPVQNDWNGSAKVALMSIGRSAAAWRVIAESTGEAVPASVADQMSALQRQVGEAFPNARAFIRPGFDEPGR